MPATPVAPDINSLAIAAQIEPPSPAPADAGRVGGASRAAQLDDLVRIARYLGGLEARAEDAEVFARAEPRGERCDLARLHAARLRDAALRESAALERARAALL